MEMRRRRVSQILFQATIYLPGGGPPGPRSLGVPPTPASASSVKGRAWGCSREDYPFHSHSGPPKRTGWALVSVALAIGCPTPAYAGHLALCCLDFPLTSPERCKRSPFLR